MGKHHPNEHVWDHLLLRIGMITSIINCCGFYDIVKELNNHLEIGQRSA